MKIMQIVGLTMGLALLTGCSFTTVQRAPLATGAVQASQSRIYVYSLKGIGGKPAKISDGDTLIGDLSNHSYLCWDRAPGKTVIRARLPTEEAFGVTRMPNCHSMSLGDRHIIFRLAWMSLGLLWYPLVLDRQPLPSLWLLDQHRTELRTSPANAKHRRLV